MGRKWGWISALKRAISFDSKHKNEQKQQRKTKKWFGCAVPTEDDFKTACEPSSPNVEPVDIIEAKDEHINNTKPVEVHTAKAERPPVAEVKKVPEIAPEIIPETIPEAVPEVVQVKTASADSKKSKEEVSAIKIQTALRGYLARRTLQALRGLMRLKSLLQEQSVKKQAMNTLLCMQTVSRVQSEIWGRRMRLSEENRALQRQLQQKREKELEKLDLPIGEEWIDSVKSKEQIEANQQSKQEAAIRRERALAYAEKVRKKTLVLSEPKKMNPNNPHWGWSWLERWTETRPWDIHNAADFRHGALSKSLNDTSGSVGNTHDLKLSNKASPAINKLGRSPSSPTLKDLSPSAVRSKSGKKAACGHPNSPIVQAELPRRHSIGGSSMADNNSPSSAIAPKNAASTQTTNARPRVPKPSGVGNVAAEKGSVGSPKKKAPVLVSPAGTSRLAVRPKEISSN